MTSPLAPRGSETGDDSSDAGPTKAHQACITCRKQKRKCDKRLPMCGLCARMARPCDYSESQPAPTADDLAALQLKLIELENRLNIGGGTAVCSPPESTSHRLSIHSDALSFVGQTPVMAPREPLWEEGFNNSFPPSVFLDGPIFNWMGHAIPRPTLKVPPDVLEFIGNGENVDQIISDYFGDIHPWLPFVSKTSLLLGLPVWNGVVEHASVLLAMKLITSQPQPRFTAAENYLYMASKRFLSLLESSGCVSLQYLQALLIVAMYEYGHGMYPEAWMTVGQCVRYADLLGLPSQDNAVVILGQCSTWVEAEERRRTWWAVYVMDKLVSLGSQRRTLCGQPLPSEAFPISDKAWEEGHMSPTMQRNVHSPGVDRQPPFARLCQVAVGLGKIQQHLERAERLRARGESFHHSEFTALRESASELIAVLQDDLNAETTAYFGRIAPLCLQLSGIMKLLSFYCWMGSLSCGQFVTSNRTWSEADINVQITAMEDLKKAVDRVGEISGTLSVLLANEEDLLKMTPLVLDSVYTAASAFHWMSKDTSDVVAEKGLAVTRDCLIRASGRWRLAQEFLKLLEQRELSVFTGPSIGTTSMASLPIIISPMATTMGL